MDAKISMYRPIDIAAMISEARAQLVRLRLPLSLTAQTINMIRLTSGMIINNSVISQSVTDMTGSTRPFAVGKAGS